MAAVAENNIAHTTSRDSSTDVDTEDGSIQEEEVPKVEEVPPRVIPPMEITYRAPEAFVTNSIEPTHPYPTFLAHILRYSSDPSDRCILTHPAWLSVDPEALGLSTEKWNTIAYESGIGITLPATVPPCFEMKLFHPKLPEPIHIAPGRAQSDSDDVWEQGHIVTIGDVLERLFEELSRCLTDAEIEELEDLDCRRMVEAHRYRMIGRLDKLPEHGEMRRVDLLGKSYIFEGLAWNGQEGMWEVKTREPKLKPATRKVVNVQPTWEGGVVWMNVGQS